MKTTFIYGLIDPRTKQVKYIGKSNNPEKRLIEHMCESKSKDGCGTKKENWINKLCKLNLNPVLKIIDEVKIEEYEYWEEFYIKEYKYDGIELLNYDEKGVGAISNIELLTEKAKQKKLKKSLSILFIR